MFLRRGALAVAAWILGMGFAPAREAQAEETILFFERQIQTTTLRPAAQGGNAVTDSSRAEIMVALGDHRLVVYEPDRVWVYDFTHRRVQSISPREGTYSDWSLFGFVAFKEMELENRLALRRQILSQRGRARPSVLDLESLFSLPAGSTRPGANESYADSSRPGHLRVLVNHTIAVDAVLSDTAFAPGRAAAFGRYLAFHAHLHPDARRALLRTGKVPRRLFYRYRDFNEESLVMLRLTRLSSAPETNDPIATSRRVDISDPSFRELNARLAACRQCGERGDWANASRRFEAAALDSGRTLDAALARVERVLGGCERDSIWPAAIDRRAPGDSAIAACRAALSWRDSTGAVAALARLDRVNGARLEKGYVLDYVRGRARFAVGDLETGAYLMMGGLGGNPCMAGGWLDLAHGYLRGYQPILAWICFEAAEQTEASACGARLAERSERERVLEKRYPELFE